MAKAELEARDLPRAGDRVDRYRVIAPIATGGMAAVFAAQRSSLGGFQKLVALKVMLPHLVTDRYFVDMFLDEARIASQIKHSSVVQVHDVVEHDGLPCIVMEFLHGRSLSALLRRARRDGREVPEAVLLRILARAARGLHAAHHTVGRDGELLGVVHRDVSPQNVHVGFDGEVKVVDFGIAAARGRLASTRSGEVKGKIAYLAPEQITASGVSAKTDVWSLGVVAWQALTGKKLFAADSDASAMWNVVHAEVPNLRSLRPELASEVTDAIMGCLQRNPEDRLDAAAVADALDAAAVEGGIHDASAIEVEMLALFGKDKEREQEILDRTISGLAAKPLLAELRRDSASTSGAAKLDIEPEDPTVSEVASRRRSWLAPGLVALVVVGAAATWALNSGDEPSTTIAPDNGPEPGPTPEPVSVVEPEGTAPAPTTASLPDVTTVLIEVADAARLVLVDGVRHDERPVVAKVRTDRESSVEVITHDGLVVRRMIGAEPETVVLSAADLQAPSGDTKEAQPGAEGRTKSARTSTSRRSRSKSDPDEPPRSETPPPADDTTSADKKKVLLDSPY